MPRIFMGFRTLDVGQQALIHDSIGRARIENGPQRLFMFRSKFEKLQLKRASQNQYMIIKHRNGNIEHLPGPCAVFKNHLLHDSISIKESISLDANEVLVVYKQDPESKVVSRYLKYGPTLFVPDANEWLHEFCWHGTDPNNKTKKKAGILRFTKLPLMPDQFYYNVDMVRTADDAVIRIKLMIFYELRNVEMMLNATKDPIGDIISTLNADVIDFASKKTYMEFIDSSSVLNEQKSYPKLSERCKKIGFEVTKVVYRGYFASPTLQKMHDRSVEARSTQNIRFETEEQKQQMIDVNLKAEMERITIEQEMELEELKHSQEMEINEQTHKHEIKLEKKLEEVKRVEREEMSKLEGKKAASEQQLEHLRKLNILGVELNEYLLSQSPRPAKIIQVVGDGKSSNFHLHQSVV